MKSMSAYAKATARLKISPIKSVGTGTSVSLTSTLLPPNAVTYMLPLPKKSYAGGTVTGEASVGGVVGEAYPAVRDTYVTVTNCYSTATVTGEQGSIGGVVGSATGKVIVTGCYGAGTISGKTNVGGVVGNTGTEGTITGCAALNPSVSASDTRYGSGRVFMGLGVGTDNIFFADMKIENPWIEDKAPHKGIHGTPITDLAKLKATYTKNEIQVISTIFDDTTVWNTFTATELPTLKGVGPQTLNRGAEMLTDAGKIEVAKAAITAALAALEASNATTGQEILDAATGATLYNVAVAWDTDNGVTVGTSATTFSPNQTVTRQEMAVFMERYAKEMKYEVPATREAVTFADNGSIGSWAAVAVKQMQMAGVLNGKDGNRFDPIGEITRGEVAAIFHRFIELIVG